MRSPHHSYNDNDTEEQYHRDHLQNTFLLVVQSVINTFKELTVGKTAGHAQNKHNIIIYCGR